MPALSSRQSSTAPSGCPPSPEPAILQWMQQLAPHGILTTDTDLRIQTWNHWLEAHSGLSAQDTCGRPLLEVFPDLVTRRLDEHFRHALAGQVSLLSTALHRYLLPLPATVRDSGFQYMQQTARIGPLLSGPVVCGTITTIEDVTQREMQASALRQHAAELENKVRERTSRLDETVAQLESFSYTVAHDLRAPIRTFKGYTELLLEDYAGEFPEPARRYLERMKRAAEGMDLLTRDLLQFSKISRQQISAEPIDVGELLDEIVLHTPALQQSGILDVVKPLHPVIGNRTMLQQCLSNLLDNALKFVSRERPPRVTVRSERHRAMPAPAPASQPPQPFQPPVPLAASTVGPPEKADRSEGHVRIYVEDNGIGIAPEHHRQVFGVFERVQGSQKFEGTGIGLAIVARAVQRMQGHCGVDSVPGHGSRFWIELAGAPEPD
jgi:signal transduction histidine kinase